MSEFENGKVRKVEEEIDLVEEEIDLIEILRVLYKARKFLLISFMISATLSVGTYFILPKENIQQLSEEEKEYKIRFHYMNPEVDSVDKVHVFNSKRGQLNFYIEEFNYKLKEKKLEKKLESSSEGALEKEEALLQIIGEGGAYSMTSTDKIKLEAIFSSFLNFIQEKNYKEEEIENFIMENTIEKQEILKKDNRKKYALVVFLLWNIISILGVFIKSSLKDLYWEKIKN